jgi:hypothetical protein
MTAWQRSSDPRHANADIRINGEYKVRLDPLREGMYGHGVHLSIERVDGSTIRDWRDLQRIKNELAGPEWTAVEIFPRESELVDTSNQFHLWAFERLHEALPFMFQERFLCGESSEELGTRQRSWPAETRPPDVQSPNEILETRWESPGDNP